ncbi:septal ring lytic transglycosylase RlpA family protein [Roseibium polysiphoniae]|uniref:septal ring lytic transglycosylase RlpA family protein n=1 Tax=Roseibium polysiphoniae TaxID=2571221 RepID=UPI003299EBDB
MKHRYLFQMLQLVFLSAIALSIVAPIGHGASAKAMEHCGKASWYALTSRTASGEMADPSSLSAAHRSLPFGTMVQVKNLQNGKTVVVRINDRGPFVKGRIIDVTRAAAVELGFLSRGVTKVEVRLASESAPLKFSKTPVCGD